MPCLLKQESLTTAKGPHNCHQALDLGIPMAKVVMVLGRERSREV